MNEGELKERLSWALYQEKKASTEIYYAIKELRKVIAAAGEEVQNPEVLPLVALSRLQRNAEGVARELENCLNKMQSYDEHEKQEEEENEDRIAELKREIAALENNK